MLVTMSRWLHDAPEIDGEFAGAEPVLIASAGGVDSTGAADQGFAGGAAERRMTHRPELFLRDRDFLPAVAAHGRVRVRPVLLQPQWRRSVPSNHPISPTSM